MARIPTPIPKSLVTLVARAFRGRWTDTAWKSGVLVLFILFGLTLAAVGTFGYIVGGIILGSLLTETVQQAVSDVWNRNFWVFRT